MTTFNLQYSSGIEYAEAHNSHFKSAVTIQALEIREYYLHENKQCCKEKEGCPLNSVQYHLKVMDVC